MTMLKTALIQMTSGPDMAVNLAVVRDSVRAAAAMGAQFILTPENTCHMRGTPADKLAASLPAETHPFLPAFAEMARDHGVWLLAGSLSVKVGPDKLANRSILFDAKGNIVAEYDKIHLFDVDLAGGESYRESATVRPGDRAVVASSPWGGVGLTICYDIRFAALYRALAQAGAGIMTVPAAFTVPTGQAHWHTLLRARAIETGSFVLAPGQCGTHEGGRGTYGHSLIINPWGEILAEGGVEPGIITADLDLTAVDKARAAIPALKHDRPFKVSKS